ncbi:MAG: T9SS type A sorting domain-containing protein, partial [bacterium]
DQSSPDEDPFVWTGSHNWSDAANTVNDENTIVIHDATVANLYYQEFKKRFDMAIPISEHPVLDLGPDQTVNAGDTVTLDAGQFQTYNWSTGENEQIIKVDSSTVSASYVGPGIKKIYCRVIDAYGVQSDTVLITFKNNPGISEQNPVVSSLKFFPNPAKNYFNVSFNSKTNETIRMEMIGFDGKVIWQSEASIRQGVNSIRIDQFQAPAGLYMLRLRTSAGDIGKKIMIN